MTGKDIFKIWAPTGAKWVDWVRPVPFVAIKNDLHTYEVSKFTIPNISYSNELSKDTAIVVDLPGNDSIKEGVALAKLGFRPIPIYNGTNEQIGAMATVDNHAIEIGLMRGAIELRKIEIDNNARPVFLLDSNRTHRFKMDISVFDNSWDIYPQDIPSAKYLIENGINKIIVRSDRIQKDLSKILYKFQQENIKIFLLSGYEKIKEVKLKKPLRKDK